MRLHWMTGALIALACLAQAGIARAQMLGAQPGYNSVLLKQEARRQQFQAQLQAQRAQRAAVMASHQAAAKNK